MTDYIIITLLVLILFGNSRYGVSAMNGIENKINQFGKFLRRLGK